MWFIITIIILFFIFLTFSLVLTIIYYLKNGIRKSFFECEETLKYDKIFNDSLDKKSIYENENNKIKFIIRNIIERQINGNILFFKLYDIIKSHGDELGFILHDEENDILWILFRGTYRTWQVKKEIYIKEEPFYSGTCHSGTLDIYKSLNMNNYIKKHFLNKKKIYIGGYSLGGILASYLTIELNTFGVNYETILIGTPKTCSESLAKKHKENIINYQNTSDIFISIYLPIYPFLINRAYENLGKIKMFSDSYSCYINNHSLISYYNNLE